MRSVDTSNTRVNSMAEIKLEDLRKWFGKGKKGDWVRVGTDGEIKGQCAREPGEGKPKCMPRSKAHSMDKKDRASSARRKRRADPMADRPGTGNKPIMVKTDKKESVVYEDVNMKNVDKLKAAARDFGKNRDINSKSIEDALMTIVQSMRVLDKSTSGRADVKHEKIIDKQIVRINNIINKTNYGKTGQSEEGKEIVKILNKHKLNGPRGFHKVIYEGIEMNERNAGKSATGYNIYHDTYSAAMQHAYAHAKKKHGVTVRPSEIDDKVATGPKKPSTGKTVSHILKTDKKQNLHVQVYNTGRKYELNMYVESVNEASKVPAGMKFIASYVYKDANGKDHTHRHLRKGTKMTDPVVVYIDDKEWKTFQSFTKAKQAAINHIKGMKESVDMNEETAIAHQTPYGTVTAYKRDTKGMRGKQDGFKLTLKTKSGKTVDLGSHPKPTKANVMSIVKNVMQKESVELDEDNKFFFVRVGKPGDTMTVKYKAKNSREALKKAKSRHFGNPVTLDPNQKQGRPVGPLESVDLEEKNVPTNPALWAKFKAQAKAKFDVYPSAYANGWAAKKYKAAGGSWKKESVEMPEQKTFWDVREGSCGTMNAQTKKDEKPPFKPTRRVGVKKDRFGNVVKDKNRAKHLAKLAMRGERNEKV